MPEYDFSQGIRGKHYQQYQRGHTVKIHQEDGTTSVQHFTLEDGAVMLAQDVREYFPDSESVNQALRGLIRLIPNEAGRSMVLLFADKALKSLGRASSKVSQ